LITLNKAKRVNKKVFDKNDFNLLAADSKCKVTKLTSDFRGRLAMSQK
jgi:hypothetical protein